MPANSLDDPDTPPHLRPPPMDHGIGGCKPSQYTGDMASIILARVRQGETITQIAADEAMPSYRTLYDWLEQYPGFGASLRLIRRDQAAAHRARLEAQDRARAVRHAQTPRARSGRKSTYSRARAKAVCAMIECGLTARQIGRRPRMPSLSTIHYWLRRQPDFRPQYAEACRRRDVRLWVQIHTLVDEVSPGNFPSLKRSAAVIEKRKADMTPLVWRWD
ncbi:MAG TPA: hypothetical protein VGG92_03910 [Caulobacteraceae bacterium]|jgi:hypothetical protein